MSSIYLPYQKLPRWNIDQATIVLNCARMGLPVPVLSMPMWEGAGNKVHDYSRNQNYGTFQGNTSWLNNILSFDGTGDGVKINHSDSVDMTEELTFITKVKLNSVSIDYQSFVGKRSVAGYDPLQWGFSTGEDVTINELGFWVYTDAYYNYTTSSANLQTNTWYVFAVTYNKGTAHIYIDGREKSAGGALPNVLISNNDPVHLGYLTHTSINDMNGYMEYALIFNRELSAAQVATLYNNPHGTVEQIRKPIWIVPLAPTTPTPTTVAPTTSAPTTAEPTTLAPTTPLYTTIGPTTIPVATTPPSTTAVPTTFVPTTLYQTTIGPTTKPSTTTAPTTIPSTTLAPTTIAPTTLAPTTSPATTVFPTTEPFTTPIPTTVAPTTLQPTTAIPTTLAPTTAEPTTLAPTTVAFTTLAPTTLAPTTTAPTTIPPTTIAPTTSVPTTTLTTVPPTTAAPETICIKALNSIITEEIPLRSLITKEIRFNGYLC